MAQRSTLRKILIPVAVVVVVLVAAGAWYLLKPEKKVESKANSVAAGLECGTATAPASLDGEWKIATDCDNEALLRIKEEFASGLKDYTAVGSMQDITGSMAIDGTSIATASFAIDMSTLTFIDTGSPVPSSGRANAMKNQGLQTTDFPEASFELTEPIDLGSVPEDGKEVPLSAKGDLTLHGVTKPVTLPLKALITGDTIQVTAAATEVVLADFDIEKPSAPFVADIADDGTFEFTVFLKQA